MEINVSQYTKLLQQLPMSSRDSETSIMTSAMHIGHVDCMSVSGHSDRRFMPLLRQCVVSFSKTLNPHCFRRISCEMSTRVFAQCYYLSGENNT